MFMILDILLLVIGLQLVLLGILSPFLIRKLAKKNKFFTFGLSNHIKFVERGGSNRGGGVLDHMIPEVPGYILENNVFRPANPGETQTISPLNKFLHNRFGVYYYGFYPFKRIRTFMIKKEYENLQGTGPKDWISPGSEDKVDALRFQFPRPYVYTDVELADRFTVDLKVVLEFEVVNPYIPVYVFHDNFFTQAGSILQSYIIDEIRKLNINDFISAPKGEVDGMLSSLKNPTSNFNQELVRLVGLRIIGISINDYQPGDEEIIKAIRLKSIEAEIGEAKKVTSTKAREAELIDADKYEKVLEIETRADAARQNALAKSRHNYVRETMTALVLPASDPTVIARSTADIIEMEVATSKDSKLTTLVKDRNSAVIPVGGGR